MPAAHQTTHAAMILHFRDRTLYSLTGVDWARRYIKAMQASGVRMMLSGVDPQALALMERVELVALLGRDNIFLSTPRLGESTAQAYTAAQAWLAQGPAVTAPQLA